MDQVALGVLRIPIDEWPLWTLRDFDNAYEVWQRVNIKEPWERIRALSYYQLVSQGAKIKRWQDVFPINGEKKVKKQKAIFREPTKDEIELLKNIRNG